MTRIFRWRPAVSSSICRSSRSVFALLLIVAAPGAARADTVPWWRVPAIQRQLALTRAQVDSLEGIFRATHRRRLALNQTLSRTERELAHAMAAEDDDLAVTLVGRVAMARAARNTERTMMLVRMYRVLTPQQRRLLPVLSSRRGSPPESIPLAQR